MKTFASLTTALLIAMIAFGCGGGDENSSDSDASNGSSQSAAGGPNGGPAGVEEGSDASRDTITTSSLSKAQFVKRANALCTRAREERLEAMNAYGEQNADLSQEERLVGVIKEVFLPTMEAQLAELRALGAPRGDRKQVERIIVAYEQSLDDIAELEGAESTPAINRDLNQAGALARKYGLRECTYG